MDKIISSEKSVLEVLQNSSLKIPEYQRPYKWERRHIRNLFYDIREAIDCKKNEYRIGSIILHNKNENNIDIVDGQQRLISISLLLYYVDKNNLPKGAKNILNGNFVGISQLHAKENFEEWRLLCSLISEQEVESIINFIENKCIITVIEMPAKLLIRSISTV